MVLMCICGGIGIHTSLRGWHFAGSSPFTRSKLKSKRVADATSIKTGRLLEAGSQYPTIERQVEKPVFLFH